MKRVPDYSLDPDDGNLKEIPEKNPDSGTSSPRCCKRTGGRRPRNPGCPAFEISRGVPAAGCSARVARALCPASPLLRAPPLPAPRAGRGAAQRPGPPPAVVQALARPALSTATQPLPELKASFQAAAQALTARRAFVVDKRSDSDHGHAHRGEPSSQPVPAKMVMLAGSPPLPVCGPGQGSRNPVVALGVPKAAEVPSPTQHSGNRAFPNSDPWSPEP